MGSPHTAREALIADALGEIAELLDRVEAVTGNLDAASEAATRACERLQAQAAALEPRMVQLAEHAKVHAVKHVAQRTRELMRDAADAERRSMAAFASALFHTELNPALHSLQQAAKACAENRRKSQVSGRACASWALASALLSGALMYYIMRP